MIDLLIWCTGLPQPIVLRFTDKDRAVVARNAISRALDGNAGGKVWADDAGGEVEVRLRHVVAVQIGSAYGGDHEAAR